MTKFSRMTQINFELSLFDNLLNQLKFFDNESREQCDKLINIYKQKIMSQQAQSKNQKFKIEIRRKQREQIMKKQREAYIVEQKKQKQVTLKMNNNVQVIQIQPSQTIKTDQNNLKQLYQKFIGNTTFMDSCTIQQIDCAIKLILKQESIISVEGAALLGSFLQFCGSLNSKYQSKISIIKSTIQINSTQQRIFELIDTNIKEGLQKKVKLYLHCLKNMALIRMERIVDKQLLQKYLMPIIQNFISEPSVLVFLSFVSQFHSFSPQIVEMVCQQANFKEKIIKIMVVTIINNYVALQTNSQNIFILFENLTQTLIHLYINCKSYGAKYGHACLLALIKLISKFPEGMGKELLKKIAKTKLQDTMIVMLSVSNQETKEVAYELQETIVDKTIHELKQQFFIRFSQQIVYQFVLGIQYTNVSIVSRCLKILTKLFHYSNRQFLIKLESEHDLSYVLEDLSYHKNQFISTVAEELKKRLSIENDGYTMNDQ